MASFTEGELEVMEVLWGCGEPVKPAEIQKHFSRPIKNAALRSALLVLLEKGHVTRKKTGKAFYYQPSVRKETAIKRMTKRMAEVFYGGSSAVLIAHLIESEKLSEEDIQYLKEVTDARSTRKKNKLPKGAKKP